ncbi:MAG: DUF4390 domain-containing protein [Nitrospiraceae bacterium]|nr:DUF4390 domain-containing protein [Nitrospiraceae bacterium]
MFRNALLTAILFLLPAVFFLALPLTAARATSIQGLAIRINGGDLLVSARLAPDGSLVKDLRAGMEKKLVFYVDLFRHWSSWPDEFIMGRKIERDVDCDSVKGEYVMVTQENGWALTSRYASCNELIHNALILKNIKLSNLGKLIKGRYYVRVTAESSLRSLPPLLGQMFFFIRNEEFSVQANSPAVNLGGGR